MRKLLLIPFILLFCLPAASHNGSVFYVDTSIHPRRDDVLSFSSVRVLSDGMDDTVVVTYALPRDTDRRPKLLLGMATLCPQAENFLNANAGDPNGPKLTMILRRFRIIDALPALGHLGMMQLRVLADFYRQDGGTLKFLHSVDTFYEEQSKLFRDNYTGKFISACLLDAASEACACLSAANAESLTEAQAVDQYRTLMQRYPLYSSHTRPVAGVYETSADYLALRPTDSNVMLEHVAQMNGKAVDYFYARKPNGKKGAMLSAKQYFAASDGANVYFSWTGIWHKAIVADGEYAFTITRTSNNRAADYVPSLVGAAIVSVAFTNDDTHGTGIMYYLMQYSLRHRKWVLTKRLPWYSVGQ